MTLTPGNGRAHNVLNTWLLGRSLRELRESRETGPRPAAVQLLLLLLLLFLREEQGEEVRSPPGTDRTQRPSPAQCSC